MRLDPFGVAEDGRPPHAMLDARALGRKICSQYPSSPEERPSGLLTSRRSNHDNPHVRRYTEPGER